MNFAESISSCFSQYANFRGRASRSEYWFFTLFYFLVIFGAMILDIILFDIVYGLFYFITWIALLIPCICVWVRRLHDINVSGWWWIPIALTTFIFVGVIWWLVWAVQKGDEGSNEYGANPLEDDYSLKKYSDDKSYSDRKKYADGEFKVVKKVKKY